LAGSMGFEPTISGVTGQRGRPNSPTSPYMDEVQAISLSYVSPAARLSRVVGRVTLLAQARTLRLPGTLWTHADHLQRLLRSGPQSGADGV
jgi:hypothetical protein